MAEAYLRYFTAQRAEVYSGGLDPVGLHPLAGQVMAEDNISLAGAEAKSLRQFRRQKFDYVITVCDEALESLPGYIRGRRFLHYSVPDPGIGDLEGFRDCRETVKKHMLRFIGQELSKPSPQPVK